MGNFNEYTDVSPLKIFTSIDVIDNSQYNYYKTDQQELLLRKPVSLS